MTSPSSYHGARGARERSPHSPSRSLSRTPPPFYQERERDYDYPARTTKRSKCIPAPEVRKSRDQGGKEKEKGKQRERERVEIVRKKRSYTGSGSRHGTLIPHRHNLAMSPWCTFLRRAQVVFFVFSRQPSNKQDLERIENELKEKVLRQKVIKSRDQKVRQ